MKFVNWLSETDVFKLNTLTSKQNILTNDFNDLNIKYKLINKGEDDWCPNDENCEGDQISFSVSCDVGFNNDDSVLRQIKRLLMSANWTDLGLQNKQVLYKKDSFIRIYNGINKVVVSLRNYM